MWRQLCTIHPVTCLELLGSGADSLCRGLGAPFRRPDSRSAERVSAEGSMPVCSAFCPLLPGTCDFSCITSATGHDLTWICSCILDLVSCKHGFMSARIWFSFTLIYVKQDFLPWSVYNTYNSCSALAMAPFSFLLRWDAHGSLQWLRTGLDELAGAEFWIWGLIIGTIATRITALSVSLSLLSSGQYTWPWTDVPSPKLGCDMYSEMYRS